MSDAAVRKQREQKEEDVKSTERHTGCTDDEAEGVKGDTFLW